MKKCLNVSLLRRKVTAFLVSPGGTGGTDVGAAAAVAAVA